MNRFIYFSEEFLCSPQKIIYGISEWSKYIFFTAITDCIQIDGFFVEDNKECNSFLGKRIYTAKDFDEISSATIFDVFGQNIARLKKQGVNALQLLRVRNHKPIVLYGAGKYGLFCRNMLKEFGINDVRYFCDRDEKKQGYVIDGLSIISPHTLSEMKNDVDTVICVDPLSAQVVISELTNKGITEFCWYQPIRQDICIGKQAGIEMTGLSYLQHRSPHLRIIGEKDEIAVAVRQLNKLNISFISAIDVDGFVGQTEDIQFINKYEIAYDESDEEIIYIGLPDEKGETLQIAKELGVDHRLANLFRYKFERKFMWDPNIGYVKNNPLVRYRTGYTGKIRIGILGGSTSDEAFCAEKTWVEYLAELLNRQGIDAEIFNASAMGYASAQELIRLCRDLIPLKPDIVISYSGINDTNEQLMENSRFVNIYQNDVFSAIDHMNYRALNGRIMEGIYCGTANSESVNSWISHERMMHAICTEFGIRFWGIAQPSLYALIGEGKRHKTEALNMKGIITIDNPEKKKRLDQIYDAVNRMDETWLVNFSDIFELCEKYPFMDGSHLLREGNDFLANNIYQLIKESIMEILE